MSLKDRLLQDMKSALKNKDELRKSTISMARAAILQVEKDKRVTLDDDAIIDVLSKEVKQRKGDILEYQKVDRQDVVDNLNKEIEILSKYLPKQLSEAEVDKIVVQTISETNVNSIKDMGIVMKALMPKVKGKVDGKFVNQLVRKHLQS